MYRLTGTTADAIPHTAIPVEIYKYQTLAQVIAKRTRQHQPPEPMVHESLAIRLSSLPPHEQQLASWKSHYHATLRDHLSPRYDRR
jgi:hypothetical protein